MLLIAAETDGSWAAATVLSVLFVCITICVYAWFRWGKAAYNEAPEPWWRRDSPTTWHSETTTTTTQPEDRETL